MSDCLSKLTKCASIAWGIRINAIVVFWNSSCFVIKSWFELSPYGCYTWLLEAMLTFLDEGCVFLEWLWAIPNHIMSGVRCVWNCSSRHWSGTVVLSDFASLKKKTQLPRRISQFSSHMQFQQQKHMSNVETLATLEVMGWFDTTLRWSCNVSRFCINPLNLCCSANWINLWCKWLGCHRAPLSCLIILCSSSTQKMGANDKMCCPTNHITNVLSNICRQMRGWVNGNGQIWKWPFRD